MRLDVGGRVAAHHAAGEVVKREQAQERLGESLALVGDDAPGELACADFHEQLGNAFEEPRLDAQLLLVEIEEALAQRAVALVFGRDIEPGLEQPARSARSVRARDLGRQGRQAPLGAHPVQRAGEIGSRVRQRAVQVEQDRADPGFHSRTQETR